MSTAPALRVGPPTGAWRGPGCGVRCVVLTVRFPGKTYPERVIAHAPEHHEAYGQHVLAHEDAVLCGQLVLTGALEIHGARGVVRLSGHPLDLTPIEMRILCVLAAQIDHACSTHELVRKVWGNEYESQDRHMVRTHIHRLRGKLGTEAYLLRTRSGQGYVLLQAAVAEAAS